MAQQPLVLVTVFETSGSTYSKAGGQMIIDADGNFSGMLSGGCLEGDLVERARQVIDSGTVQTATYDLGGDDELWGLGVGCDGTMRVLLQPLTQDTDYQPFASVAQALDGGESIVVATFLTSALPTIRAGASIVRRGASTVAFGVDDSVIPGVFEEFEFVGVATARDLPVAKCRVLYTRIAAAPALLVLGAGLDAEPIVRLALELGWRCVVADHRPRYIESRALPKAVGVACCAAEDLCAEVDLGAFDMAIVMSHHLISDRHYLAQLAESPVGYIGLLGPRGRRDRLMRELGSHADRLQDRLHGPAGMKLGGRGPGPIALEIVAEMQQYLSNRR